MPILFRTFRNSDPPHLADVWRAQPPERALMQPMLVPVFDQLVLAKQYFDPRGLITAWDGDCLAGFAHAGFGPTDDGAKLATQMGVVHLVMVRPPYQRQGIGRELVARAEAYLRERGAEVLYAGGIAPLDGFYRGLYGGSELPGVLDSSPAAQRLFQTCGYREIDRVAVMQRETANFRPPVDRRLMQLRRGATLRITHDPPARSWWQAAAHGDFAQVRFDLDVKDPATADAATVTFWMMETFSPSWGCHAAGLIDLETKLERRRQGMAMLVIAEAINELRNFGVSLVETQTMIHNTPALDLYRKLGFEQVDFGAVYRKDGRH